MRVAGASPQEADRRTRHVLVPLPCTPRPGSAWRPVRGAGAQGAAPKLAPSAFQSAASLPSFAVRPAGAPAPPALEPPSSSSNSAGGHVDVLRTASMPALPVVARAASDLVIIEERISLGAPPRALFCFYVYLFRRASAPGGRIPGGVGRAQGGAPQAWARRARAPWCLRLKGRALMGRRR